LSAIPIIGRIFSYRTRNKQTTELAIFITPHVMVGSDTGINVRKAVEIMENRVAGPTIDLPFHAEDPLQPTAEDSARGKPAAPSPDTVVGAVPPRKKLIVLTPDTTTRSVSGAPVGTGGPVPPGRAIADSAPSPSPIAGPGAKGPASGAYPALDPDSAAVASPGSGAKPSAASNAASATTNAAPTDIPSR
jgi:hypothetical protein